VWIVYSEYYTMPRFECITCNFMTNHKPNYERHLQTSKHISKLVKTFDCELCGAKFDTRQGRWNHKNNVCKKKDTNIKLVEKLMQKVDDMEKRLDAKDKIIMDQLKSKDEQLDTKDKLMMEIVKGSNKNTGKSMSTLAYVVKHYNKAPAMKKLSDKNAIKLLEYKGKELTSEEMMIHRYRNGTLDAYLGEIIKNAFIDADNPAKQSMWTSDVARLCFVIMYPISKGRREWIADKSGIKITELIIDPLLKNAREMLIAYIKETGKMHDGKKVLVKNKYAIEIELDTTSSFEESDFSTDYDSGSESSESDSGSDFEDEKPKKIKYDKSRMFDQSLVHNMQTAHDIRMIIDNKTLHESILKHICPFFKLNIPM